MTKKLDRVRELLNTNTKLTDNEQQELFDLIVDIDVDDAAAALASVSQLYVEGLVDRQI
jgi:hypothetical protein